MNHVSSFLDTIPEVSQQAVASDLISSRKLAAVTTGRATEITKMDKLKDRQKTCTENTVCLEPTPMQPSKHSVFMYRTMTLVLLGVKTVAKLCHARQVALTQHSLFKVFVELKNSVKMTKCIFFKWTNTLARGTMIAIIAVIF